MVCVGLTLRLAAKKKKTNTSERNGRGTEKSNKPNSSAAREAIAHFSFFFLPACRCNYPDPQTQIHITHCTICLIQKVVCLFVFVTV